MITERPGKLMLPGAHRIPIPRQALGWSKKKNDLKSAFLEVSVPMTPFHQRPWRKQNLLPIVILLSVCSAV